MFDSSLGELLGLTLWHCFALLNPYFYIFVHVRLKKILFHLVICRFDTCMMEKINNFKCLLSKFTG